MNRKIGSQAVAKYFALTFVCVSVFYLVVPPSENLKFRFIDQYVSKIDCYGPDGSYYMGSDHITLSLLYLAFVYNKKWLILAPWMLADLLFYGPSCLGSHLAALIGAFVLL